MKLFILAITMLFAVTLASRAADKCTHDLEVLCIDDINKAYPVCDQAAKEKGKDVPVDLECLKYLGTIDKECWPCICAVAAAQKWNIKGC